MTSESLLDRIANGEATIGVVGLGYVGLPLSLSFVEAGFDVKGFDIDEYRVGQLRDGESYIDDVSNERLQRGLENSFDPSTTGSVLGDCDVYILAVPTGVRAGEPDMSAVEAAAMTVAEQSGSRETLMIVSSTVYPGATEEIVAPIVEEVRNQPTHFAMVPERLNPGGEYEFSEIPLVVGADGDHAGAAATELFESVVAITHPVDSTKTAELTKTLENTYRMVNIALVNELLTLAEGLDADVWDAIDAAATKPFGFQPFYPGPGVGGHCIPIDPQFLSWRADELGTELSLVDGAQRVNEGMPELVANRVERLLDSRAIDIDDASILALGAAYKPNVGDTRNSPALQVVDALPEEAKVTVADPHTDSDDVARLVVQTPTREMLQSVDIVILLVNHEAFDLNEIGESASLVFDAQNAMPETVDAEIVQLGDSVDEAGHRKTGQANPVESRGR